MGNIFDRRASALDTSQPGVRQLQGWVRAKTPISIQLKDSSKLDGSLRWIDSEFLALLPEGDNHPILVARSAVAVIRSLA